MSADPKLRATIEQFLKRPGHRAHVTAYLSNTEFQDYLIENWKGPQQVVAIVEGKIDIRASLVKRTEAFEFVGMKDEFAKETRLVMSIDEKEGALFMELDPN